MAKGAKSKPGIIPLGDKVLVTLKAREEQTASGIIIPDTVGDRTETKRGKVVAVGEGKYDDGALVPMRVRVGDEILFQWGDSVEVDGVEYHIISESNILGIIK
ncbi:MAG TPA: co-chaperone GroES [Candidatus Paceibacterota bacterium]